MKLVCSLLASIFSNFSFSQNILVEYDILSNEQVSKCELIINDSVSLWNITYSNPPTTDAPFFFKNHLENAVYLQARILNLTLYVKDSLHSMKWELTNDTARLLNEKCFSAKTFFRGRNYTAWYTTSYANSDGPWKFGGLPGLILAVKSDDNYIRWNAVKIIKSYPNKVEFKKMNDYKFIEWNEYVKKFIATIDKWKKLSRSNGTVKDDTVAKVKLDAVEIIYPALQTGEGISF